MSSGESNQSIVARRLQFTLTPGLGPILTRRILTRFGPDTEPRRLTRADLATIRGIGPDTASHLVAELQDAPRRVDEELQRAQAAEVRILHDGDDAYPALLQDLPDAPLLLYVRGQLTPDTGTAYPVAIVGSRRCTPYGTTQARRFAGSLAGAGLTIVSGGARGIDTAAHHAAAQAGGHTIAVLGCGLDRCYPPENRDLFDAIVEADGAIVSELPMTTRPAPENFPARNRIIAGMSLGVLVVEAPGRSGALITARIATEAYGREVFAIPGRIDTAQSSGTNGLIREGGASAVLSPTNVTEDLEAAAVHVHRGTHAARFAPAPSPSSPAAPADLSELERRLLEVLQTPRTLDQLLTEAGCTPEFALPALTGLELRRLIAREGSQLHASVSL